MINEFKQSHEKYKTRKTEYLIWLEKEIQETCGTSKLSQRMGFSNSYIANAFNRGTSDFDFWVMVHDEMIAMNEEKARLLG